MEQNPEVAIDAVLTKNPLSLAKIAVLEKAKSPVLRLELDALAEDIRAAYLYSLPVAESVAAIPKSETESLEWLEKVGDEEYRRVFLELVEGLVEFYKMLPSATQKKTETTSERGTDGSQS